MVMLTIRETYLKHIKEYPDSQLSLNSIRSAVLSGELKSISAGTKRLINWDVFNNWLGYDNHIIAKLMKDYETSKGLTDAEKDILIKLLIEKYGTTRFSVSIRTNA